MTTPKPCRAMNGFGLIVRETGTTVAEESWFSVAPPPHAAHQIKPANTEHPGMRQMRRPASVIVRPCACGPPPVAGKSRAGRSDPRGSHVARDATAVMKLCQEICHFLVRCRRAIRVFRLPMRAWRRSLGRLALARMRADEVRPAERRGAAQRGEPRSCESRRGATRGATRFTARVL